MGRKKIYGIQRKSFSLVLNEYVHMAIKKYCIDQKITMCQFFDEAMNKHLKECQKEDKKEGK